MRDPRFIPSSLLVVVAVFLVGLTTATGALGQVRDTIPRNSDAELMFEQGLSAFEQENYEIAYERFRLVTDYDLNRTTTAAMLMAGKSLLRMERYQEAIDRLETLLERYPETSYREEAERAIEVAQRSRQEGGQQADTLRLGILLPMSGDQVSWSQAFFNGVRLAVDEHNGIRRRFLLPSDLQASADTFEVYDTADAYSDSLAEANGATTVVTPRDTVQVDSLQVVTERVERPDWIAKMYFRQVGENAEATRAVADSLVRQDEVDVIVGPLVSPKARAAGERAEQAEIPLVAPLATDESVSSGRDFVFQVNPTIPLRGRLMARFAEESLLLDEVGVIYERGNERRGGPLSEQGQMVEGFQEGAQEHDLKVPFTLPLDRARDWSRLPEAYDRDSTLTDSMLTAAEALYVPMTGSNATGKIQDALTGISRLRPETRVLGNSRWHDLPVEKEASEFRTTYTNDFYVQTGRPEVQKFIRRYRMLTGSPPDELSTTERRLAYTGYDVADFLLTNLSPSSLRFRPETLRSAEEYEGLGVRIHFQGNNVNEAMFFHRYRDGRIELLH